MLRWKKLPLMGLLKICVLFLGQLLNLFILLRSCRRRKHQDLLQIGSRWLPVGPGSQSSPDSQSGSWWSPCTLPRSVWAEQNGQDRTALRELSFWTRVDSKRYRNRESGWASAKQSLHSTRGWSTPWHTSFGSRQRVWGSGRFPPAPCSRRPRQFWGLPAECTRSVLPQLKPLVWNFQQNWNFPEFRKMVFEETHRSVNCSWGPKRAQGIWKRRFSSYFPIWL